MKKHEYQKFKLPLDSRNRVCLTRFLTDNQQISSFRAYQEGSKIVLEPQIEVPAEQGWLYTNQKAKNSVEKGLRDIKAGKIHKSNRDFSEFLESDEV